MIERSIRFEVVCLRVEMSTLFVVVFKQRDSPVRLSNRVAGGPSIREDVKRHPEVYVSIATTDTLLLKGVSSGF